MAADCLYKFAMSSYEEIWKTAQESAKAGDFKAALAHYLQCAEILGYDPINRNQILHLYSSIVFTAYKAGQAKEAVGFWLAGMRMVDSKTEYGMTSLLWLISMIPHLESLVKHKTRGAFRKNALEILKSTDNFRQSISVAIDKLSLQTPATPSKTAYSKHKISVADPFLHLESNWQEDDWLAQEIKRSDKVLAMLKAGFRAPEELQKAGWSQLKRLPHKQGKYFYFLETILGTRHVTIHRSRSLDGHKRLLLETTKVLKEDETFSGYRINKDGNLLAYGISARGSDRTTWHIINLKTKRHLDLTIKNVLWGSIYFSPDGKKLYYQRQRSDKEVGHRVPFLTTSIASGKTSTFHKPISKDSSNSSPALVFAEKYILATETRRDSLNTRLFLQSTANKRRKALELLAGRPGRHIYLGWFARSIFLLTDQDAPNKRVLKLTLDAKYSKVVEETELIEESEEPIETALFKGEEMLLLHLSADATDKKLRRYNRDGELLGLVKTPFPGWIDGLSLGYKDSDLFYGISSRARARTLIHHDLKTGKNTVFSAPKFKTKEKITSEILYARSADGTLVPMHISYQTKQPPSVHTPCLINMYGGFSHNMFPSFDYQALSWISMGGTWCQPFLRGGAELGEEWHKQAIGTNKERTFEDALACAQYLIDKEYTSREKLAIKGSSNGGLTVGVLITRHPELFGAAIATNGLFDMLKFATHSVGWSWEREYGSVENKKEFTALKAYSPYHNITGKALPALLLCVSDSDDRVLPWHTIKFAAGIASGASDKTTTDKNPTAKTTVPNRVILRLESKRGHSANQPSHIVTDQLAFLHHFLKMK